MHRKTINILVLIISLSLSSVAQTWKNVNLPVEKRIDELLQELTLEEKILWCSSDIPAIERLGIPSYMWYAEALHGIIAWNTTAFPQNSAMGCTWNPELMLEVSTAISDEARAMKNQGEKELMYFSPTVNIARDPRWGRNGECYSEDPYHLTEMAKMYIRGMQGYDTTYLKTICTVKHFVANNVEHKREWIQSNINERDLREYYFPAYKACIVEEGAEGIMTGLNGLNGIPCAAHEGIINGVLREEWGFKGYVIADWGAVGGIYKNQKYADSYAQAAAIAIKSGCDQECFRPGPSMMVKSLMEAIEKGLLTEEELDASVRRLLRLRFLTGDFDDPADNPYSNIPSNIRECKTHKKLALKAAEQAIVLLKNENNILPLSNDTKKIAVSGPFADNVWLGIYAGFPKEKISHLTGIQNATNAEILYAKGCGITEDADEREIQEAVEMAKVSDVAIVIVGNDESTSTENTDRSTLALPGAQQRLIEEVYKANKNTIVVFVPSGPTTIGDMQDKIPGIICAWPGGQQQGNALANVLFGKVNPGGKVNSTWFASDNDLPDMHDYNVQNNRTYMYFNGKPIYPFGYGLSYTTFEFSGLQLNKNTLKPGEELIVSLSVKNTGKVIGDEVVQIYIKDIQSDIIQPAKRLKAFTRVTIKPGEGKKLNFSLPFSAFSYWDSLSKNFIVEEGSFEIQVGSSSADIHLKSGVKAESGIIPKKRLEENVRKNLPKPKYGYIYYPEKYNFNDSSEKSRNSSMVFKVVFTDPGYYVNTWDAEIVYTAPKENTKFQLSIEGVNIETLELTDNNNNETQKVRFKIPIPPEYGKELEIKGYFLKGYSEIKELLIYSPEGEAFTYRGSEIEEN